MRVELTEEQYNYLWDNNGWSIRNMLNSAKFLPNSKEPKAIYVVDVTTRKRRTRENFVAAYTAMKLMT